jgi:hypothetical protein
MPEYRVLLYGGAIRGGKTFCALAIAILLCRIYPKSRWVVVRRDSMTIRRNTLPSFWKICPNSFLDKFNGTQMLATFKNESEILFLGENFDRDRELNRFRGLEVNGFILEEANELNEATYHKSIERAGSNVIKKMPDPLIIMTCNPNQGFLKTRFYDPWKAGKLKPPYFYLPSKIFDNPHIPASYLESIKQLPPEIYNKFVEGDWEGSDDPFQLVPWSDLYRATDAIPNDQDEITSIGADIAGHGRDRSVFIVLRGQNIAHIEIYQDTSVQQCYHKIVDLMMRFNTSALNVCVDGSGLGSGVVDLLKGQEYHVVNFIGGSASVPDGTEYSYKNLKSQAYWWLRQAFVDGDIGNVSDDRVRTDVASIWYEVENERMITIEPKSKCRQRLGRSPDFSDALCYAWWGRVNTRMGKIPGIFVF